MKRKNFSSEPSFGKSFESLHEGLIFISTFPLSGGGRRGGDPGWHLRSGDGSCGVLGPKPSSKHLDEIWCYVSSSASTSPTSSISTSSSSSASACSTSSISSTAIHVCASSNNTSSTSTSSTSVSSASTSCSGTSRADNLARSAGQSLHLSR